MRLPCERVVNEALPAVRSMLANELQAKGYSQTEIADLLNITQPAVSQYLSATRGQNMNYIDGNPEIREEFEELMQAIMDRTDDEELSRRLHDLCAMIVDEPCKLDCQD